MYELDSQTRVLVTGASGFVGARVVEAMDSTRAAVPVAGIRNWTRAPRLARRPVEIVQCDILDREQVRRAVRGVDAIVHCATADERATIVDGTRHLLDAAVASGIDRFVFLSTAEVYGPKAHGTVDERYPVQLSDWVYADSKIEAETLCRQYHQQGIRPVILRPSIVYGPFSPLWTVDTAVRLQSGRWSRFEGIADGLANLVYVDDLVQAILRSLGAESARGATFNINGPEVPTWNEFFERFNEALGLPPLVARSAEQSHWKAATRDLLAKTASAVRRRFEDPLMRIYERGGTLSRWMKRLKQTIHASPSVDELQRLYSRHAHYDDSHARLEIHYAPRVNLDEGLRLSVEWLRLHDLAPAENGCSAAPEVVRG